MWHKVEAGHVLGFLFPFHIFLPSSLFLIGQQSSYASIHPLRGSAAPSQLTKDAAMHFKRMSLFGKNSWRRSGSRGTMPCTKGGLSMLILFYLSTVFGNDLLVNFHISDSWQEFNPLLKAAFIIFRFYNHYPTFIMFRALSQTTCIDFSLGS